MKEENCRSKVRSKPRRENINVINNLKERNVNQPSPKVIIVNELLERRKRVGSSYDLHMFIN